MASISISASLQRANSSTSPHLPKKQQPQTKPSYSSRTNQATPVVTLDAETRKCLKSIDKPADEYIVTTEHDSGTGSYVPKFIDKRWKNGTWDLNMFVNDGTMDWDGVILAEARRRKFLEVYPEAATNQEPVLFRSSIIPWWAWLMRSYLPEAELLNGRAAMVGFFMAYMVDALTGLDIVGQSGNFICKAGLFSTVIGVILFRQSKDVESLKKLADEANFYDKQWQASWQHKTPTVDQTEKNI